MGVRPCVAARSVSAFLLYCWDSPVLSAPSVHVANSQLSVPDAAPEHRILLIWRTSMGTWLRGSKDLRVWSSS